MRETLLLVGKQNRHVPQRTPVDNGLVMLVPGLFVSIFHMCCQKLFNIILLGNRCHSALLNLIPHSCYI